MSEGELWQLYQTVQQTPLELRSVWVIMRHRPRPSLSEDRINLSPIRSRIKFREEAWPARRFRFAKYMEVGVVV